MKEPSKRPFWTIIAALAALGATPQVADMVGLSGLPVPVVALITAAVGFVGWLLQDADNNGTPDLFEKDKDA